MSSEKIATTTITKTPNGFTIDVEIPKPIGRPFWFEYITPALLFLLLLKKN
jgi:hypothetical protein